MGPVEPMLEALEPRYLLSADLLPVSIDLDPLGDDLLLTYDPGDGIDPGVLKLLDAEAPDTILATLDPAAVGAIELRGGSASERLTIDLIEPFPFDNPIHFSGGAGDDSLVIVGGSHDAVTHGLGVDASGTVELSGAGGFVAIAYDGVEAVADLADAAARVMTNQSEAATVLSLSSGAFDGDGLITVDVDATRALTVAAPASFTIAASDSGDRFVLGELGLDAPGSLHLQGGAGIDVLAGPVANTVWNVTGADSGEVAGVSFVGFEVLEGAAGNEDTFVLGPNASVSGRIDGGAGGFDALEVNAASGAYIATTATGPHSGAVTVDGVTTQYLGLEPVSLGGTATNVVVSSLDDAFLGDQVELAAEGDSIVFRSASDAMERVSFGIGVASIEVLLGAGDDNLTVGSLGNFAGSLTINGQTGDDSVLFAQSLMLDGGNLTVDADSITVAAGALLSTRAISGADPRTAPSTGDSGDATFRGRTLTLLPGSAILAQADGGFAAGDVSLIARAGLSGFETFGFEQFDASASVMLDGAEIRGGMVTVEASASTSLAADDSLEEGIRSDLLLADIPSALAFSATSVAATIDLIGASAITGSSDVRLSADATTEADRSLSFVTLAFLLNEVTTDAKVMVGDTSTVGAGGSLVLESTVESNVATTASSADLALGSTEIAVAEVFANAWTIVGAGAEIWAGSTIDVLATVTQQVVTKAKPSLITSSTNPKGSDFAFSYADIGAVAAIDGKANAGGDLTVEATASLTHKAEANTDPIVNRAIGAAGGLFGGTPKVAAFDAAGALTSAFDETTAEARIGAAADVEAAGDVTVDAEALALVQYVAESKVEGTTAALNVALVLGETHVGALAFVGDGASVDAGGNLTVSALTTAPKLELDDFFAMDPFGSIAELDFDFLTILPLITTKAAATAATKSNDEPSGVTLYGAATELFVNSDSRAYIGALATVDAADVTVEADAVIDTFNIVNDPFLSGGTGGAVTGATLQFVDYNSIVLAYVDDGAGIDAGGSVEVSADLSERYFGASTAAGKGGSAGLSGASVSFERTAAVAAFIDDHARVTALGDVDLRAEDSTQALLIVGGIISGADIGIGIAVAHANVDGFTQAFVGDADAGRLITGDAELDALIHGGSDIAPFGGVVSAENVNVSALSGAPIQQAGGLDERNANNIATWAVAGSSSSAPPSGAGNDSGKGSFGINVSGSVARNEIGTDTAAFVADGVTLLPGLAVHVDAFADNAVASRSGGAARAQGAGSQGIAGAWSDNAITATTRAYIDGATITGGALGFVPVTVRAETQGGISAISAGLTSAGQIGVAGSVSINTLDGATEAFLRGTHVDRANVTLEAGDGLSLKDREALDLDPATNDGRGIFAVAGAVARGGKGGAGSGVAVNDIGNETRAYFDGVTIPAVNRIEVLAITDNEIESYAASILSAPNGISGALIFNTVDNVTEAYIDGSILGNEAAAINGISVTAIDASAVFSLSGAAAVNSGGTLGLGGSSNHNKLTSSTEARIENSTVHSLTDIEIIAMGRRDIDTLSVAGAGGGTAGVAGAVTVNFVTNTTVSRITGGTIRSDGNIDVIATQDSDIKAGATSIAFGTTLGVGGGVIVNTLDNTTEAVIDGGAVVDALALGDARPVPTEARDADGKPITELAAGLAVVALGSNRIDTATANFGLSSGAAGVALSSNTTIVRDKTRASVEGGASVNQETGAGPEQSVIVRAGHELDLLAIGGTVAGASTAGVGAANDTLIVGTATDAAIDGASIVAAAGDILVEAHGWQVIDDAVVGGAGGGTVGAAASVAVGVFESRVAAIIGDATLAAGGDLTVEATQSADLFQLTGGIGGGGTVGFGGAVGVATVKNTTAALISAAAVTDAAGHTGVAALSSTLFDTAAITGGGGGTVGLAGSVLVKVSQSETTAAIQAGASVNQNVGAAGVSVTAEDSVDSLSIAGGLSIGATAAIGAATDVQVLRNQVRAEIGDGAAVRALGAVDVAAISDVTADSYVFSGGGGGTVGINGAVSVLAIGAAVDDEAIVSSDGSGTSTQGQVDVIVQDNQGAGVLGTSSNAEIAALNAEASAESRDASSGVAVAGAVDESGAAALGNTDAIVGAGAVVEAGSLSLLAESRIDLFSLPIGFALSGTAGIGGAVDVVTIAHSAQALVGDGAVLDVAGSIALNALSEEILETGALAAAGGGTGALSGSVVVTTVDTATQARLGNGVMIGQSGAAASVELSADSTTELATAAGSTAIGGVAAIGAAVDTLDIGKTTAAVVGAGSMIDVTGSVAVEADARESIDALSLSFGGGGTAGVGAMVTTVSIDNDTIARIEDLARVAAANNVLVTAAHDTDLFSLVGGGQLAGVVGVAAGVGTHSFTSRTVAEIGDADVAALGLGLPAEVPVGDRAESGVFVSGLSVGARSALDATTDVFGITGAGTVAAGASVLVNTMAVETNALIGAGAGIEARDVRVAAANLQDVFGGAQTLTISGAAAIGGAVDTESFDNTVTAGIGGASVMADDVVVEALNDEMLETATLSANGGIGALGASVSVATLDSETSATLEGTALTAAGGVDVRALSSGDAVLIAGQAAGGGVTVGASVANLTDRSGTSAAVDGASVAAGGAVAVAAESARTADVLAVGGAVSLVAGSGAVADLTDLSSTTAALRGATAVDGTPALAVTADSFRSFKAESGQVSAGGLVIGVVLARIDTADGAEQLETIAEIGSGVALGGTLAIGSLELMASAELIGSATGLSIGAGLVAGAGGGISVDLDSFTAARLGAIGVNALSSVDVLAEALTEGTAEMTNYGASLAGVDVSIVDVFATPRVEAAVAAGADIQAGSMSVIAEGDANAAGRAVGATSGLLSGNGIRVTAAATPDVVAEIESGAGGLGTVIETAGDLTIEARGKSDADSEAKGAAFAAGVGIGVSLARAEIGGTVAARLGAGASITSGGSVGVRSSMNIDPLSRERIDGQAATAFASAASGALLGGGAGAESTADAALDVDAAVGAGASITATDIVVEARSYGATQSDATAATEGVFVAASGAVAGSSLSNLADAVVAGGAALNAAQDLDVGAETISVMDVVSVSGRGSDDGGNEYSEDNGGALALPSLVAAGGSGANGSLAARAEVTIGAGARLTAGRTVDLFAANLVDASVLAEMDQGELGAGGILNLDVAGAALAFASLTLDADATVDVGDDVVIRGDEVIIAADNVLAAAVLSDAVGTGLLGSVAFAKSTLVAGTSSDPIDARVILGDRADIQGNSRLALTAFNDSQGQALLSRSFALYDSALLGFSNAIADGTVSVNAAIDGGADTKLSTSDLLVLSDSVVGLNRDATAEADGGVTKVVTVVKTVTDTIRRTVCRWAPWPLNLLCNVVVDTVDRIVEVTEEIFEAATAFDSRGGAGFDENASITLNGEISNFGTDERFLRIDENGEIDPASSVGATLVDGQWVVDDIVSDVDPRMIFRAPDGTIDGAAIINLDKTIPRVEIVNESDHDLVLGRIAMIAEIDLSAAEFDLAFDSLAGTMAFAFAPVITESTLIVTNTGEGDIIFGESISNVSAFIEIVNTGGDILTADPDVVIEAGDVGHLLLEAAGSVGTAGDRFDVTLVRGQVMPDGSAGTMPAELIVNAGSAHIGLTGINTTQAEFEASQSVDGITLNLVTEDDLDLAIGQSLIRDVNLADHAADGTYTVMQLVSTAGDVTVSGQAAGSDTTVDFGLIPHWMGWQDGNQALIGSGTVGTMTAQAGTARIDVTAGIRDRDGDAAAEILADRIELAAGAGGIGEAGNDLEIDALSAVEVAAAGDVRLTETAGAMLLDGVASTAGEIFLTADRLVGVAVASFDLMGSVADLDTAAGVGTAADPLQTSLGTLSADGGAGGVFIVNTGALTLDDVTAAGAIEITAMSPIIVNGVVSGPTVDLTAVDGAGDDDDVVIEDGAVVTALAGDVVVLAGDNIVVEAGATIAATGAVLLDIVDTDADAQAGGSIVIEGNISAAASVISGTEGDDIIAIQVITAGTPMIVNALGGADTVRVGSMAGTAGNTGGDLVGILAGLTVIGGAGDDTLDIDASGAAGALAGRLESAVLSGLGMGAQIGYGGFETLAIGLGGEADTFVIAGTHAARTEVGAGGGGDWVTVESVSGETEILGQDGADTIRIGLETGASTAGGIGAALTVRGGAEDDDLILDDTGDAADDLGTVTGTTVGGFGMSGLVSYETVESLALMLGAGDDRVNVRGTTAATSVSTGAGGDMIYVSSGADLGRLDGYAPARDLASLHDAALHGTLDAIEGPLSIDAGGGSNSLAVSDRADADADGAVVITGSSITGLAPAAIAYVATGGDFSGQGALTRTADLGLFGRGIVIYGGGGGNSMTVQSVAAGGAGQPFGAVSTTLFLGSGDDQADLDIGAGLIAVRAEDGQDTIDASSSTAPVLLFGDGGNDTLLGGSAADLIFGDSGRVHYLAPAGSAGFDIVLGGAPAADYSAAQRDAAFLTADVAATVTLPGDGDDLILAGTGDDVALGGDGADRLGGGMGRDLLIGDAAVLSRTTGIDDNVDPRFRTLTGTEIYGTGLNGGSEGAVLVAAPEHSDPRGIAAWSDWSLDVETVGAQGSDTIGGGTGDDMLFGGGGNDTLRGDRDLAADGSYVDTGGAGHDYIEGNAGDDMIFGDLGQDDLIGGSSSLFGLAAGERGDGADTIYGGTGDATARNDAGDASANGHAADSDMILGDNGNIYRIGMLGAAGFSSAAFNYDQGRGAERIVVRAAELIDYTPGGVTPSGGFAIGDAGAGDVIHGEAGDDFVYGMTGSDELFGDGQDDDLIGGRGHDVIYGGAGVDGVLGDDGRIFTSSNTEGDGLAEPLYGIAMLAQTDRVISTPGNHQISVIDSDGALKKTADLTPFDPLRTVVPGLPLELPVEGDDVIFGGLGDDFLHGGLGDDAISGAEARPELYGEIDNPGALLEFGFERAGEFADYDEFDPLARLDGFLLNPEDGAAADGADAIFGDIGNDWLFGGTERDRLYGGFGDDLLDADDDKSTNGGANDVSDPDAEGDVAFGGAGRDILIANTAADRLIDWVGQFNAYITPDDITGGATISRALQPQLFDYLVALGRADGADPTRVVDGGDPEQGGEPYGELGLVTPLDTEFRAQTGAPLSPLLGEIPDGEREVLAAATFNDGQADGFAADSGTWSTELGRFSVSPEVAGGDAVSVYHLQDPLPSYFEVTAFVNAGKEGAGLDANSYLIFDYQSETDFKFAGINGKTNKLEIGHRTAEGWIVDVQTPMQIQANRSYQLLLSVNASSVALIVNNEKVLRHDFEPRVVEGITFDLNSGLLGVGAQNSKGFFDNVIVQILPPEFTFEATHAFDGATPFALDAAVGSWEQGAGRLLGTSAGQVPAQVLVDLGLLIGAEPGAFHHDTNGVLELSSVFSTSGAGGFIFDRYAADDYKFVVLDAEGRLSIGHYTQRTGWVVDVSITLPVASGEDVDLSLLLKGSSVSVALGGVKVLEHAYNAVVVDGGFGLLSVAGEISVDSLTVRTSDDAFSADAMLAQATGAGAESVSVEDANALLDEAAARLAAYYGVDESELDGVEIRVEDLGGRLLAHVEEQNVIVIDDDAAGLGWFVDGTPELDEEYAFASDGTLYAIEGGDADDHIDLLTVLTHELGHIAGLEHDDTDLMSLTLSTGLRLVAADEPAEQNDAVLLYNENVDAFVTREHDRLLGLAAFAAEHRQASQGGIQRAVDWHRTIA